jgi:glycosyltransferase involved in cell wall biosynthesis
MQQPLVSVIIPCYNVEKYVSKAIHSVLQQTYPNMEILIVDDASTDRTLEIIKGFTDSRIKRIALEQNTRKIGAVNLAIEKAQGEFIAFQDADDWSETNRLQLQVNALLQNTEAGICFTGFDIRTEKGLMINEAGKLRDTDELIRAEFFKFLLDENSKDYKPSQCATMLVKSKLIKDEQGYHSFFKGRVAEDVHLVYRILKKTKAVVVNQNLYHFLRSANSLTVNQISGLNAKGAYAWELLSKIIEYDQKGINLLLEENTYLLNKIELEACETALSKTIQDKNAMQFAFESSSSYRLGKLILNPVLKIKKLFLK